MMEDIRDLVEVLPAAGTPAPGRDQAPDQDQDRGQEEGFSDDFDAFLAEARAQGGDDAVVDCYRYDESEKGKGRFFVGRIDVDDYSIAAVEERFGGGKWYLRLRYRSGKYIKSMVVRIEGPPKAKAPAVDEGQPPPSLMQSLMDTQRAILGRLEDLRREPPPPPAPGADPFSMGVSLLTTFQALIEPYQKAILKQNTAPASEPFDFKRLVSIFEQGVKMGALQSDSSGDPMTEVLSKMLPPIVTALGGGSSPGPPAPGVEGMAENPPPDNRLPEYQRPPWDAALAPALPHLLKWARDAKNPAIRAAFVADDIPDAALPALVTQMERGPEFLAEFFALHPEARQQEAWFREFWEELAGCFDYGDTEETPDAPPPSGVEVSEVPTTAQELAAIGDHGGDSRSAD